MKKLLFTSLVLLSLIQPQQVLSESLEHLENKYHVLDGSDWRDAEKDFDLPWSEPVIIRDEFTGEDYLAVLDRNYNGSVFWEGSETGVLSNWSKNYIRVVAYIVMQDCGWFSCKEIFVYKEVKAINIRIDKEVYRLQGEDSIFLVTAELANRLSTLTDKEKVQIQLQMKGSGEVINSDIGEETIKSWKVIYSQNH